MRYLIAVGLFDEATRPYAIFNGIAGMMHTMDHDKINAYLAKLLDSEGLDVQLSYDGMLVPVNL